MDLLSGFADISLAQLLLVAVVALIASVIGGVRGVTRTPAIMIVP